jgi:hypothetical protein
MQASSLPYVDEHATDVAADAAVAWDALRESFGDALSHPAAAAYGRLVGCDPSRASGPRPLEVGSTVPGFRVVAAEPERELVLEGRHRFSTYALVFRIDPLGAGRCRLRAETRAVFPGAAGGLYRLAVIRSGGHVVGVRRLLAGVRRRAEQRPARPAGG